MPFFITNSLPKWIVARPAKHYGRNFKVQTLRQLCEINREGVSLLRIRDAAGKIGFRSFGAKLVSA